MEDFRDSIKKSFQACKTDIETLKYENSRLKDDISKVLNKNSKLKEEVVDMKAEIKGLKIAIDYIKEFNSTNIIQQPIPEIKTTEPVIQTPVSNSANNKIKENLVDPYEALLAFKAKSNKREILKQKMLSMIGESGMNLSELKFMFVDHFKYCSKATFYNYLKELELERYIRVERENSKNFVYNNSIKKEI